MEQKLPSATDHLANERTFLAWIRTSIAIMAFGFVAVKFALFVKQIALVVNDKADTLPSKGYSAVLGVVLVGIGVFMALFSYFRYKRIERDLLSNTFQPSSKLSTVFTFVIILVGLLLIVYLLPNIWS